MYNIHRMHCSINSLKISINRINLFVVIVTKMALQPHKMARGLKFRIKEEEGLYYPYSENKGADQLCGYLTADLRLCFRMIKNPGFS